MVELFLETATDICSVAVARDGVLLAEVTAGAVHQHASHLTRFIQQAVREAGTHLSSLDAVVLSDGPGSYTSLRVGAATAKGLCAALPGLVFEVVPTLEALARASQAEGVDHQLAVIDSRRGEVFGQVFSPATGEALTEVMNVRLTEPTWRGNLLDGAGLGRIQVCGPGQARVREVVEDDNAFTFGGATAAAARYLLAPARRRPGVAAYAPFYLNPPFVTRSKKKSLL